MIQNRRGKPRLDQHGAALVVSLILLLIMTIIGIAAMNSAQLEIRMAGMMQREEVALRAAERTLWVAEEYIEGLASDEPDYTVGGNYSREAEVDVSKTDWTEIARLEKADFGALGEQDAFVVQYLGTMPVPGSSVVDDPSQKLPGDEVNAYRITTRSETTKGNAVRIVESTYTK